MFWVPWCRVGKVEQGGVLKLYDCRVVGGLQNPVEATPQISH